MRDANGASAADSCTLDLEQNRIMEADADVDADVDMVISVEEIIGAHSRSKKQQSLRC